MTPAEWAEVYAAFEYDAPADLILTAAVDDAVRLYQHSAYPGPWTRRHVTERLAEAVRVAERVAVAS